MKSEEIREMQQLRDRLYITTKKYQCVIEEIAKFWNESSYYSPFAAFGDMIGMFPSVEADILAKVRENNGISDTNSENT